ncbi:MAG: hypothetical protein R3E97_16665 [Candidatus Eisenbacteria bacterium]
MTSDFDNRWRTGGNIDEVIEEAHLSPEFLMEVDRTVRKGSGHAIARLRTALRRRARRS